MRGARELYLDFSGGVNLETAPYLLADNQARDALNVQTTATGQIRKRNGFTTLADLSAAPASFTGAPHSLFACDVTSGKLLVVAGPVAGSEDKIVSISGAGTVTDLTAGAATFDQGIRWSFAQAAMTSNGKGPIFAMNGVDTPQVWDGNIAADFADWTAASGTLPVTGNFLTYHGFRLWCAELAVPGRVRFSGITGSNPDTGNWDANGYVDLEPADGQAITAIYPYGSYLLVFKARKVYVIYDLVTGAYRQISDVVGTISPRSVVETPAGVMFLDEGSGIMSTDGNSISPISSNVDVLLREAAQISSTFKLAAGTYFNNRYYLSLSTGGSINDRTLEYDIERQSWWVHDCASNQWALLDPAGTPRLYSTDPAADRVQRAFVPDVFQDSGVNYAGGTYVTGAWLTWGETHIQKRVRQVRIDGQGEWTLCYATNFVEDYESDQGEVWESSDQDPLVFAPASSTGTLFAPSAPGTTFAPVNTSVTYRRYYTLGVGRAWSFKLVSDDSGDFRLYSMTVAIGRRED